MLASMKLMTKGELYMGYHFKCNEKSAPTDANTARALAVVRFGHRPPVANTQTHKHTDRTDYNTLRRS